MFDSFLLRVGFAGLLIRIALFALFAWFPSGCATIPDKSFDVINGLGVQAAEGLKQGVGQWSASFEGVEPGYTVEGGVKYFATAKMEGIAGQFHAGVQGEYSSDKIGTLAATIMQATTLSEKEKIAAIKDLLASQPAEPAPAAPVVVSGLTDADREWLADEIKDAGASAPVE